MKAEAAVGIVVDLAGGEPPEATESSVIEGLGDD
jgi:hypothetical protein